MDLWADFGLVSGSIAAFCAAIAGLIMLWRMTVRGVRRMFRVMRQAAVFFQQVNGDDEHPSIMEVLGQIQVSNSINADRLSNIEKWQAEHVILGHPAPAPLQRGRRKGLT